MNDEAMSTMPNEVLVQQLIDAAEQVGLATNSDQALRWESYAQAKATCEFLRKHVLLRLKGTCGLAGHLDKAI